MEKLIETFKKNKQAREENKDKAEAFMESEVELFCLLQEIHTATLTKEEYETLVCSNENYDQEMLLIFFELFLHENTDITGVVCEIFNDMFNKELYSERLRNKFSESCYLNKLFDNIAVFLHKLSAVDDFKVIEDLMSVASNIIELNINRICKEGNTVMEFMFSCVQYLLDRKSERFHDVYNSITEVIATLVQNFLMSAAEEDAEFASTKTKDTSAFNFREFVGETDLIADLLELLVEVNKKQDESSNVDNELQIEYMENIFDSLCGCLTNHHKNREIFIMDCDGLKHLVAFLKAPKSISFGALKMLDWLFSMNFDQVAENENNYAHMFIDKEGLKYFFPYFGRKIKKRKSHLSREQYDDYCLSMVAYLLRSSRDLYKRRVLHKFTQNGHDNVKKLLDMFAEYTVKLNFYKKHTPAVLTGKDGREKYDYFELSDNGLFTLQLVTLVVMELLAVNDKGLGEAVADYFRESSCEFSDLLNVYLDYQARMESSGRTSESARLLAERMASVYKAVSEFKTGAETVTF